MVLQEKVSLSLNVRGLGISPTLAINEKSRELAGRGCRIFRLGLGQSPFPIPASVVDSLKFHAHRKEYLAVKGLEALREAVASFHRREDKAEASAENVIIGPGSKELMFLLQVVFYGEIIVPTPCWVSYVPQARIVGREVKLIPTSFESRWKITPDALLALLREENDKFRPRLLVLNYPANPDGESYTQEELMEIADIVRKFDIILLSDEIYAMIHHKGEHVSISRFYPEGTIISSGLSKWCGAGGWRLGTFTIPSRLEWLLEAMAAVASETYTSVNAPVQYAAVTAFSSNINVNRYLWHVRRILSALGKKCAALLRQVGARVHDPVGAFYLFPDFSPMKEVFARRGITTSREFCDRLLMEAGVAALPGEAFERPPGELTLRIAYVNFDGAKALAASENIPLDRKLPKRFLGDYCQETITAIEKLAGWIESLK
ncbi:MAG: aminotransferase class I/II-fold pyridoxal phosphate-dependent enzyme [Candidatus Eremiobacteraeota bacterium]|nr:aminotransferase class I/II-fold pyridoxal phosphate-dependent enzyme [Candidatus Eremiobacteraeota bacterium]